MGRTLDPNAPLEPLYVMLRVGCQKLPVSRNWPPSGTAPHVPSSRKAPWRPGTVRLSARCHHTGLTTLHGGSSVTTTRTAFGRSRPGCLTCATLQLSMAVIYLLVSMVLTKLTYDSRGSGGEEEWTEAALSSLLWPIKLLVLILAATASRPVIAIAWSVGRLTSLMSGEQR
jgi:hypothetical protein